VLEWLGKEMDRALRLLPGLPPGRMVHVSYRALVADTLPFVLDLRRRLNLEENSVAAEKMGSWMKDNGDQNRGAHKYDATNFGLDGDLVDERFSSYRRAFASYL
jgi:hypothetical protein